MASPSVKAVDTELEPRADHGEDTYVGTGRLKGRKALMTGGDSGIGAAVAIAFAREGADVAIAHLPSEEQDARNVLSVIEAEGRVGVGLAGDLLDEDYRNSLVDLAAKALGGLDILVKDAGKQIAIEKHEELDDAQIMKTFQVNILAMFTVSRTALKHFPNGATIINTTSVQACDPSPTLLDYASTKAAVNAFTEGLAVQLAPRGIRVNAAAPGPIWTPLRVSDAQPKEALPKFGHNVPLGRAGQPVELAPAYVFMASAESSYVVEETLNVNGGKSTP